MNKIIPLIMVSLCGATILTLAGCRGGHPDISDVPGMIEIDQRLKPFVWHGEIHYEKFHRETREVRDSIFTSYESTSYTHILDSRGRFVSEVAGNDSVNIPSDLTSSSGNARVFIGAVDPASRLLYAYRYHDSDMGMFIYDVETGKPTGFVELVSLPAARSFAIEYRNSEMLASGVRERLERAGCKLPPQEKPLHWNTDVFTSTLYITDMETWQNMSIVRKLMHGARRISAENREMRRFHDVLVSHFEAIVPDYEAAFSRFIADNLAGAYIYSAFSYVPDENTGADYVVLPDKGFAFEITPVMKIGDLPRATSRPRPDSEKNRCEISVKRTGRKSWWKFEPVAFIPLWKRYTIYRHRLSLNGEKFNIWNDSRSLKVLDYLPPEGSNGVTYFSLIGEDGMATLYSYDQ
jgi:hypothetical protein